jgi:hypothetical protein
MNVLSTHQGTPASLLFEFILIGELSDEEIESVLNSDHIDRSSIALFLSQAAQRFLSSAKSIRARVQRAENQQRQAEKSVEEKEGKLRVLRQQLAEERAGHAEDARRVIALKEKNSRPAAEERAKPLQEKEKNRNRFNWTPDPEPEPEPVPEVVKAVVEERNPPRERQKPKRKNDFFYYAPDGE